MEQPKAGTKSQTSQAKPWSDAELRRVARVFELLIRIDKRQKERGNENGKAKKPAPQAS